MALDDQLAALAAGDLDDATARALRARVAGDADLQQRLAQLEELDRVLRGWQPQPLSDGASDRLHARVDDALAELDDGPLAAAPDDTRATSPSSPAADGDQDVPTGEVVDLDTARQQRRQLPSWVSGPAAAAVLVVVVGAGAVALLPSGSDSDDTVAVEADQADQAAEAEVDGATTDGDQSARSDEQLEGGAADSGMTEAEQQEAAPAEPDVAGSTSEVRRLAGVVVDDGELLTLVEDPAAVGGSSSDQAAADLDAAACLTEALERDTPRASGREVVVLATGTYNGDRAVFTGIRTPAEPSDHLRVLAHDPVTCALLGAEATGSP